MLRDFFNLWGLRPRKVHHVIQPNPGPDKPRGECKGLRYGADHENGSLPARILPAITLFRFLQLTYDLICYLEKGGWDSILRSSWKNLAPLMS